MELFRFVELLALGRTFQMMMLGRIAFCSPSPLRESLRGYVLFRLRQRRRYTQGYQKTHGHDSALLGCRLRQVVSYITA